MTWLLNFLNSSTGKKVLPWVAVVLAGAGIVTLLTCGK